MENHPQRLKDCEFFEEIIPEDISQMVLNLNEYRKTLKGDFEEKSRE
jgi:precorrin-2 dehydrogenase/sirohydrochlorin ferrochelatase